MPNRILYKYRSWSNDFDKKVLSQNEFYLSSPKSFNDPFDCRITADFRHLSNSRAIERYIDKKIETGREYFIPNGITELQARQIIADKLKDLQQYQKDLDESMFAGQDEHYGVLCLSERWN